MVLNSLKKITLVGAGNLGWNLLNQLVHSGFEIVQVVVRSKKGAKRIEESFNVPATERLSDMNSDADLCILSLPDDEINSVLPFLNPEISFVVHTSGSLPMDNLSELSENFGVFYPLQSFSKEKNIDFADIPVCLEASSKKNLELLTGFASRISDKLFYLDSEQRRITHVAAVFANNFVNNMYHAASDILKEHDIPFEILLPLIRETAEKVLSSHPGKAQTGPAVRNDLNIISSHLEFLEQYPELKEIYAKLTDNIIRKANKK